MSNPSLNGTSPDGNGHAYIKGLLAKYPKLRLAVYIAWFLATAGAGATQPFLPEVSGVLTSIAAVLSPFALATLATNMPQLRKNGS